MPSLCLASGSKIRADLLRNAGLEFLTERPRLDEDALRQAMRAEASSPRDMADHLAEMKAVRVAMRDPSRLVLGCDQVLEFEGEALGKPESPDAATALIRDMSGKTHLLHSALVLVEAGHPAWRLTDTVRLTMRPLSDTYIAAYVSRNWEEIRHCAGGYQLESEGVRLFSRIEGDYFSVLGLPLLPLLDHLALKGVIET